MRTGYTLVIRLMFTNISLIFLLGLENFLSMFSKKVHFLCQEN